MTDGRGARMPTTIRLPEAVENAVRTAAERSGRTLTAELRILIERGLDASNSDDGLFGETPEEVAYNRAFGQAVAIIRFSIGQWNDPRPNETWRAGDWANVAAAYAALELAPQLPVADAGLSDNERCDAEQYGRTAARLFLADLGKRPIRPTLAALARTLGVAPKEDPK